jgi:hypothetical protein
MNKLVNRRFMDFEMTAQNFHSGPPEDFNSVIPRRAGIQIDMDVSERILANLDAGYPCRHDERRIFIVCK